MLTCNDFKAGDILIFTGRTLHGEELRIGVVTFVNFNGLGGVTYTCYHGQDIPDGCLQSGSGWFKPEEVGTKKYGFYCAVNFFKKARREQTTSA